MENLDLLIPTFIVLTASLSYRVFYRYTSSDEVRLKAELDGLQLYVALFASKVSIVEQYIEEFWRSIPDEERDDIEELLIIRAQVERVMECARKALREKDYYLAWNLVWKLCGDPVTVSEEFDTINIVAWEERSHRLILRLCQKLTLEASVGSKKSSEDKYKRQPTLVSLKEISDLFREERSLRM